MKELKTRGLWLVKKKTTLNVSRQGIHIRKGDKTTKQSVVKLRLWLALSLLRLLPSHRNSVTVVSLPGTDFFRFKTYMWRVSSQPIPDVRDGRIISNVDAQLAAKA